ncbi:unnamed protein product [Protopolystoma xenopodis]|uniref:aspartyl aminopeptidase n=1 Tax=Protopolystoma xenopodis TaxID=117903 RepID=A0A448XST3_9PLAT|nr:unnamed protein product [Protopolystoma xenopodis]
MPSAQIVPNVISGTGASTLESTDRHPASLLALLAAEVGCRADEHLVDIELYLADTQPACLGGLHEEFIHAPRLDNLFNTYAGIVGFIDALGSLPDEVNCRVACMFDHEETGSTSTQGANSTYSMSVLRRIATAVMESAAVMEPGTTNI